MTQAEAIRRERVERWRDETQSPWEASPPGLVLWLLWRALYKGFQPLWLIASLAAALWFGADGDPFAIDTVTGTAAVALWALKAAPTLTDAEAMARRLWDQRHQAESLSA